MYVLAGLPDFARDSCRIIMSICAFGDESACVFQIWATGDDVYALGRIHTHTYTNTHSPI